MNSSKSDCLYLGLNNGTIPKEYADAKYFGVALTTASLYMTISLLAYEFRRKSRKRAIVNHLVTVAVVAQLLYSLRIVSDLFNWIPIPDACELYRWAGTILYPLGISIVYTILWARQRKFYADPLLGRSVNKCVRWLSSAVIIAIYITAAGAPFGVMRSYCYYKTDEGCLIVWNNEMIEPLVPFVVASSTICFVCQLVLFGLITQPLLSLERQMTSSCRCVHFDLHTDIHNMIKRLAFCTSACVLTSMLMHVIVFLDALGLIHVYWMNFMAFDLLFSNLAVIYTFADWRQRVWPFAKTPEDHDGMVAGVESPEVRRSVVAFGSQIESLSTRKGDQRKTLNT